MATHNNSAQSVRRMQFKMAFFNLTHTGPQNPFQTALPSAAETGPTVVSSLLVGGNILSWLFDLFLYIRTCQRLSADFFDRLLNFAVEQAYSRWNSFSHIIPPCVCSHHHHQKSHRGREKLTDKPSPCLTVTRRKRRKGRRWEETVHQTTAILAALPRLVPLLDPGTTVLTPNTLTFSENIRETPKVCVCVCGGGRLTEIIRW